jgi:hypothetical protein
MEEEKSKEKINPSNIFLIIFGVLTFVFIFASLIFLNSITANVIGESRGNYYGIIFVFSILGIIVFLEILTFIKKREKPKKNIQELIKESS